MRERESESMGDSGSPRWRVWRSLRESKNQREGVREFLRKSERERESLRKSEREREETDKRTAVGQTLRGGETGRKVPFPS